MPESADLALIEAAAREGGEIALRHFRKSPKTWEKGGGAGPVSEADLAVNDHLSARLRTARPDYGWLSEESADDPARLSADRLFIVDPIDGTRAFLSGDAGFAICVAVVEGGAVTAAVVHLPARQETYAARRGGGATRNGTALRPSPRTALSGARALCAKSQLAPSHWPRGVPPVTPHLRKALAWRLCLVAAGDFDLMLTLKRVWEWDAAAGSLIAQEAGCAVTLPSGAVPAYNNPSAHIPGLLAAPLALHAPLLAALRPD